MVHLRVQRNDHEARRPPQPEGRCRVPAQRPEYADLWSVERPLRVHPVDDRRPERFQPGRHQRRRHRQHAAGLSAGLQRGELRGDQQPDRSFLPLLRRVRPGRLPPQQQAHADLRPPPGARAGVAGVGRQDGGRVRRERHESARRAGQQGWNAARGDVRSGAVWSTQARTGRRVTRAIRPRSRSHPGSGSSTRSAPARSSAGVTACSTRRGTIRSRARRTTGSAATPRSRACSRPSRDRSRRSTIRSPTGSIR